jgi:hypothetical protein
VTKIKLTLENLRVESFTTSTAGDGQGTVFGRAKSIDYCATVDYCGTERETGCIPGCETWAGMGACSVNDGCASSPHEITGPCSNCVETEFCVIDGGELG